MPKKDCPPDYTRNPDTGRCRKNCERDKRGRCVKNATEPKHKSPKRASKSPKRASKSPKRASKSPKRSPLKSSKKIVVYFKRNSKLEKVELEQTSKMNHIKDVKKSILSNKKSFGLVGDIKRDDIILKDLRNKKKLLHDDEEINRNLVLFLQIEQLGLPSPIFGNVSSFLGDHNKVSAYLGKKAQKPDLKHVEKFEKYLPIIERLEKYYKKFEKYHEYIKILTDYNFYQKWFDDKWSDQNEHLENELNRMRASMLKLGRLLLEHNFSKTHQQEIERLTEDIIDTIKFLSKNDPNFGIDYDNPDEDD